MSRTKEEALAAITAARAGYKDFVSKVDEDLRIERARRLAVEQGNIYHLVAEAYTLGSSIADIKRAYGTKDHRTIARIVESIAVSEEIRVSNPEVVNAVNSWFTISTPPTADGAEGVLLAQDGVYDIILLDDGEDMMTMLAAGVDRYQLDGAIESMATDSEHVNLFRAVRASMR